MADGMRLQNQPQAMIMLVMLLDTRVRKIRGRIQVRVHGAFDARLDAEQIIRRHVQRQLAIQPALLLGVEHLAEGILGQQKASSAATVSGHVGLAPAPSRNTLG